MLLAGRLACCCLEPNDAPNRFISVYMPPGRPKDTLLVDPNDAPNH